MPKVNLNVRALREDEKSACPRAVRFGVKGIHLMQFIYYIPKNQNVIYGQSILPAVTLPPYFYTGLTP